VVAFCNIEAEIYGGNAKQRATNLTSEDEDNKWNGDNDQEENGSSVDTDPVFVLDSDINLKSLFLQGMLSDAQTPECAAILVVADEPVDREARDREPTEDDWTNM